MERIDSRRNAVVSAFRALARDADPRGTRVLLDGAHLVRDARAAGLSFETVVVAAGRHPTDSEEGRLAALIAADGARVVEASDPAFEALSPVTTPSGIVAIARRPATDVQTLGRAGPVLLLIAADVQDPGNVGAVLRTAEAAGVAGAVVCGHSANPYSWKALRGSMGAALRLPVALGGQPDAVLAALRDARVRLVAAVPRGGRDPDAVDWQGRVAIVLGGEGAGLAPDVVAMCDDRVSIPMAQAVESLNVAAAAAVLVYAARRRRS